MWYFVGGSKDIYIYIYINIFSFLSTKLIFRIGHCKEFQRLITRALVPPQTFPVNPQKKHKYLHIKLSKNRADTQKNNQSNKWLWACQFSWSILHSYKPRFTLLTFIIDNIVQKKLSCWYSVSKMYFFQTEKKCVIFFQALTSARCCYNKRLIYLKNKSIFLTPSVFDT